MDIPIIHFAIGLPSEVRREMQSISTLRRMLNERSRNAHPAGAFSWVLMAARSIPGTATGLSKS